MQTLANSNKQTTRSNVVYILFIFILYATIRLDSAKWVAVLQFSNPPGLELFIDFVQLALLMSKVLEEFHITGGHRAPSNCLCQVIHHDSRIHRGSPLASLSFYPWTMGFPCQARNSPARIAATKHGYHSILELVQWRADRFPGIKQLVEERWLSLRQQVDLRRFELRLKSVYASHLQLSTESPGACFTFLQAVSMRSCINALNSATQSVSVFMWTWKPGKSWRIKEQRDRIYDKLSLLKQVSATNTYLHYWHDLDSERYWNTTISSQAHIWNETCLVHLLVFC